MARELTPDRIMDVAAEVMSGAFRWGRNDDCTAACEVFRRLHGIDLLDGLRWGTAMEAGRLMYRAGGLDAMASRRARALGLRPGTTAPGEIGISLSGKSLVVTLGQGFVIGKARDGMAIIEGARKTWSAPV